MPIIGALSHSSLIFLFFERAIGIYSGRGSGTCVLTPSVHGLSRACPSYLCVCCCYYYYIKKNSNPYTFQRYHQPQKSNSTLIVHSGLKTHPIPQKTHGLVQNQFRLTFQTLPAIVMDAPRTNHGRRGSRHIQRVHEKGTYSHASNRMLLKQALRETNACG